MKTNELIEIGLLFFIVCLGLWFYNSTILEQYLLYVFILCIIIYYVFYEIIKEVLEVVKLIINSVYSFVVFYIENIYNDPISLILTVLFILAVLFPSDFIVGDLIIGLIDLLYNLYQYNKKGKKRVLIR